MRRASFPSRNGFFRKPFREILRRFIQVEQFIHVDPSVDAARHEFADEGRSVNPVPLFYLPHDDYFIAQQDIIRAERTDCALPRAWRACENIPFLFPDQRRGVEKKPVMTKEVIGQKNPAEGYSK